MRSAAFTALLVRWAERDRRYAVDKIKGRRRMLAEGEVAMVRSVRRDEAMDLVGAERSQGLAVAQAFRGGD